MCGFVGFVDKIENKKEILNKMMDRIIHRGPDMAGDFIDEDVALGFRRLSILDLSEAGKQPMQSEDGNVTIVFNGEIYNFMDIRRELEEKGYKFNSNCDTEALLHGYEEYGEEIVKKLRGMFGFVIWDKKENKLFGARDYFGIKPFYYTNMNGSFIFGSEIKSFLDHPNFKKEVNKNAIRPYLTFQYSSEEETFFKGVYKLPQAHFFTYKDGKMKIERYWDVDFKEKDKPFDEYVKELDSVINESVNSHRIADVKVASFLSGGIDSSYITASLMPDKTFSVGFDYDKFNETNYAKELSDILGIENVRKLITADECFDAFPTIQYHMDEPQSNPSSVPLYFLTKLAKDNGVTVVLSGEGADEIFAGYEEYDERPSMRKYKKIPKALRVCAAGISSKLPYFKGHDFIIKGSGKPENWFIGQAKVFSESEANDIVTDECKKAHTIKQITAKFYERVKGKDELVKKQYLDLNLWLPGDILLKADKMSMAHSLELRVPFLDRKVMEYADDIPSKYKITPENTKMILRKASAYSRVPEEWVNREKKGFPVPIRYWLREDKYYNIVKEYFSADYAKEFFDTDKLMKLLDDHKNEKANNQRKIWTVFTFLTWYKRFFIDEK